MDLITYAMVAGLALPPAQYDHPPTRPYSVAIVAPAEVEALCPPGPGQIVVGCTVLDGFVLLRNDMTADATKRVLRHELGHVNGWNH